MSRLITLAPGIQVITKREKQLENAFFMVLQQRVHGWLFDRWVDRASLIIQLKDFWDLGYHAEGQPGYGRPLRLTVTNGWGMSHELETWKPTQFDFTKRATQLYMDWLGKSTANAEAKRLMDKEIEGAK